MNDKQQQQQLLTVFAHDRMMSELEMTPDAIEANKCIQIEFQRNENYGAKW